MKNVPINARSSGQNAYLAEAIFDSIDHYSRTGSIPAVLSEASIHLKLFFNVRICVLPGAF